jgi:hypothetical protein
MGVAGSGRRDERDRTRVRFRLLTMPEPGLAPVDCTPVLEAETGIPAPELLTGTRVVRDLPSKRRPWVPSQGVVVALIAAAGMAVCALGQDLSRATLAPSPWVFWFGVILVVAPLTYRATALDVSSLERIGLVCLEGVALYVARLMRDPNGFTLPDEFPHALSLQNIVTSHHLYHADPLLAIVAHFPGLEGATSALTELTGMSSWGSALIFILFTRLTVTLGLFCLFAAVSRSARAAALGTLLFAANSNYLIWESQYAYESLSLPLLTVMLAAISERQRSPDPRAVRAWAIVAGATIVAIVPTHHLTSYLMVIVLWLACVSHLRFPQRLLPRNWRGPVDIENKHPIWPFALLATSLIAAWLIVVSSQTVGYLSPEVQSAVSSTLKTISGEGPTHALFSSSGTSIGSNNLLSEEAASFLEPVILLIALPFGLRALWQRKRVEPLLWILSLLGILFFVVTVFRLVPSTWEISNRSAEFMFIGISFVAGATAMRHLNRVWRHGFVRALVGLFVGLCVVGGAIAGWPANSRLARPIEVKADNGVEIQSPSEALGRWFATQPPGVVTAGDADDFAIELYGHHTAYGGVTADADTILAAPDVEPWMLALFRRAHFRYVVADARESSQDNVDGLFFDLLPPAASPQTLFKKSASVISKWAPYGARVYDNGDIVVYDLDRKP